MRKKDFKILILFIFSIFSLLFFHFRGIFYPDEGYILNTAKRILDGQIIYKDFDFVYTPLTPYLNTLSFLTFGESIFASRLVIFFLSFITIVSLIILTRLFTKNFLYLSFVVLLYLSWGPSHINFLWPTIVSVNLGIVSLLFFKLGEAKNKSLFFFISGIFTFLIFLTKQNLGLAAILAFYIYIFFQYRKSFVIFTFGILTSLIFFASYLLGTDSFMPVLKNFYDNVILKILVEKTIDTPLIQNFSLYEILKLIFYLSPLFIAIDSMVVSLKNKSEFVLFPVLSLSFFVAGFRPVTDYVHLAPLISLTGLSLLPLCVFSKNKIIKYLSYTYATIYIIIGFYSSLFVGYYRWEAPLISPHKYLSAPRVNIWVSEKYASEIPELIKIIDKNTNANDKVFINYYAPMIYFLIDRPNATGYDYLSESALTQEGTTKVLESLRKESVELIITHDLNQDPQNSVNKFINENYSEFKKLNDLTFWKLEQN